MGPLLKSPVSGEIYMARGLCFKSRNTIGNTFYGADGYLIIDGYNKYTSFRP